MAFWDDAWKTVKKGAGAVAGYYTGGVVGGAAGLGLGGGGGSGKSKNAAPLGVSEQEWAARKQAELADAQKAMQQQQGLFSSYGAQYNARNLRRADLADQQAAYDTSLTGDINRIGSDRDAMLRLAAERGPSAAQAAYSQSRDDSLRSALSQAANAAPSGSALANRQAMAVNAAGAAQAGQQLQQGMVAEDLGYRQQRLGAQQAAAELSGAMAGYRQGQVGLTAQQYQQNEANMLAIQQAQQANAQARTSADLARQGYLTQTSIADQNASAERRAQDLGLISSLISAGGQGMSSYAASSSPKTGSDKKFKEKVSIIGEQGLRAGDDKVKSKKADPMDEERLMKMQQDDKKRRRGFFHVMSNILSDENKKTSINPLDNNALIKPPDPFGQQNEEPLPGMENGAPEMTKYRLTGQNRLKGMIGAVAMSDVEKKTNIQPMGGNMFGRARGGLMGGMGGAARMAAAQPQQRGGNMSAQNALAFHNRIANSLPTGPTMGNRQPRNMVPMQRPGGNMTGLIGNNVSRMMSDERKKNAVSDGGNPIDEMLDNTTPVSFNYTKQAQRSIGEDGRRNYGVMAQDLEKSDAGKSLVVDTPKGKMVDTKKATMANLAANARLNERISSLEDVLRDTATREAYGQAYGQLAENALRSGFQRENPTAALFQQPAPAPGPAMADAAAAGMQRGFEEEDPFRRVLAQQQYGY